MTKKITIVTLMMVIGFFAYYGIQAAQSVSAMTTRINAERGF